MSIDKEELYAQRLNRYVTAMRNGKPDRIPIRPFAAEFTAAHAGYTCQEVTHDYNKAFDAVLTCCADYDWDAVVPNMVYVWTGLAQAAGLRYYAIPGIDVGPDVGFQYKEPPQGGAYMQREEYDELIDDPVRFLYDVWLPRISAEVSPQGAPATLRHNLALVKSAWAMASYFNAFGPHVERLRRQTGTVSAISGMLKAPLDVLADKFRGYVGLAFDLKEVPEKVQAACNALMPHLEYIALSGLDPSHNLPIPIWMHRGCVPFISYEHFNTLYWPTLKPIVESIWARGNQVLFYAEGKWDAHLDTFAELPAGSIVYHIDRGDYRLVHRKLGGKFCLSGGVPNAMLTLGTPDQVRAYCKQLIDTLAGDGGYIMDASAIMQNDAQVENVRAMTDFTLDYGAYSRTPSSAAPPPPPGNRPAAPNAPMPKVKPGVCYPWEKKLAVLPALTGDAALAKRVWEEVDSLAYFYIWHLVLSF
jgi:uroporphyrinogen-III decarboxylase